MARAERTLVFFLAPLSGLVAALSLAGCYLSHERVPGLVRAADAGTDASSPLRDAVPPGTPDAPLPEACEWRDGAPWQLTAPPGDQRHSGVLDVDRGFLVVYGSSNDPPLPEPGRFARLIDVDGPIGDRTQIFDAARGTILGGVGLAEGEAGVLAATWDGGGCRTRMLAVDGAPLGPIRSLPRASCVAPASVPGGFSLVDRPGDLPAAVFTVDALGGAILGEGEPLAVLDSAFWWTRSTLHDGTSLWLGMAPGVEPTRALAMRTDPFGAPLDAPETLPAFGAASRIRAAPTDDGALVVWAEAPDGDPTSQARDVRVFPVDARGRPLEAPHAVSAPGGTAYRDGGISVARAGNEILAVWVGADPADRYGRETSLVFARLSLRGELLETRVLDEAMFVRAPVLRVRGGRAIVAYTTFVETATQVHIVGLRCVPP